MNRYICMALFFLLLWSRWGDARHIDITVKVALRAPTCTVTSEDRKKLITVSFGAMSVFDVSTKKNEKEIKLRIECDSSSPKDKLLKMRVSATPYDKSNTKDNNIMKTSMDGLGIGLTKGSKPVSLNSWIEIDDINIHEWQPGGVITLTASLMPIKPDILKSGVFNSSANVVLNYE
ncbi:fimbrial subunit [Xenorhabdus mauleonii]|uniref:Fimbrial subunit n=1 Tax=Xenorhabdus mauleonii TaxID=351675 RepID=A0A1I3RPD3_9GAMM|nr:fimbrial protein [Xenorhabdus mauleonii]PHM46463.1 fimbrial subunit [Xenorhabdus mauleonii]SFJ48464.1 Pilin (type 1 fimbria component protein) [Xenorhabdus mauleonii]